MGKSIRQPQIRRQTILVVDHEEPLRTLWRTLLQGIGYLVYTADNDEEAISIFSQMSIQLVLINILIPDIDGYTLCTRLRQQSDVPIILLSALNQPEAIVRGFSVGADDYIIKPFQFYEIEARLQALLRRTTWLHKRLKLPLIAYRDIILNIETQEVYVRGGWVHLTPTEFQLLCYLTQMPDRPISKKELAQAIWGLSHNMNLVEVTIHRLREKLEEDPAKPTYLWTVYGTGYQFNLHRSQP